jgi:6-phosphogluconolactonase
MRQAGSARTPPDKMAVYASVGPELAHFAVDVEGAALIRREAVTLPANVHYAWPHASGRYLYVRPATAPRGWGRPATSTT